MIDLEQSYGRMRLRAWGLVINFVANLTALYGLALVLGGRGGWLWLVIGTASTILCLAILSLPARDN